MCSEEHRMRINVGIDVVKARMVIRFSPTHASVSSINDGAGITVFALQVTRRGQREGAIDQDRAIGYANVEDVPDLRGLNLKKLRHL